MPCDSDRYVTLAGGLTLPVEPVALTLRMEARGITLRGAQTPPLDASHPGEREVERPLCEPKDEAVFIGSNEGDGAVVQPPVQPLPSGRDPVTGRFLPGNGVALVHGRRSAAVANATAPGMEGAREALAARAEAIVADLGGAQALSQIQCDLIARYTELDALAAFQAGLLFTGGPFTSKGRARAVLGNYLTTCDRVVRLANALGIERRASRVPSLDDYLSRQRTPDGND